MILCVSSATNRSKVIFNGFFLQNIQEIRKLKDFYQLPFLFVNVTYVEKNTLSTESLTESEQHSIECKNIEMKTLTKLQHLRDQMIRLGMQMRHFMQRSAYQSHFGRF